MRNFDKYISIIEWARKRYTTGGVLVLDTGGIMSTYSRIECAAFDKYARHPRDASGCIVVA